MRSQLWPMRSAAVLLCLTAVVPAVRADERADELLREVERSTKSFSSLGAKMQVTLTTQDLSVRAAGPQQTPQNDSGFSAGNAPLSFTYTGTVKLQRPNLERVELDKPVNQTIACDGVTRWTLINSNEYIKNPADPQGKSPGAYAPILIFFAPETARMAGTVPLTGNAGADNFATRYLGKERVVPKLVRGNQDPGAAPARGEAEEFDVVEVRQIRPTLQAVKLYINSDKMVTRVVSETRKGSLSTIQDISLINIKLGQKYDVSEFAFALPPNARPFGSKPTVGSK